MSLYLEAISNVLVERSAEELILGLFAAFLLSLASAGMYLLARRKAKDAVMVMTLLGLLMNAAGMVIAVSYVRLSQKGPGRSGSQNGDVAGHPQANPLLVRDLTVEAMARSMVLAADANHDGFLSPEEAADASTRFVRSTEAEAGGPINAGTMSTTIKRQMGDIISTSPHHGRRAYRLTEPGPLAGAAHHEPGPPVTAGMP